MELGEHDLLDEYLALRREWEIYPEESTGFFPKDGIFDFSDMHSTLVLPNSTFEAISLEPVFDSSLNAIYPCMDNFSVSEIPSSSKKLSVFPVSALEDNPPSVEDEEPRIVHANLKEKQIVGEMESTRAIQAPVFNIGTVDPSSRRNPIRRVEGQPSKNLMAERRRRKRLNERLLMLRSVVPKISKMDRTAILGDTIDYMRELQGRIRNLEEEMVMGPNQMSLLSILKQLNPNDIVVRNIPKFDVERTIMDTRIEICCSLKPGLLLSTLDSLEGLGLDIQQCVISCFNDFGMQASCSEEPEMRARVTLDDIKQAIQRNAGYGGRCI